MAQQTLMGPTLFHKSIQFHSVPCSCLSVAGVLRPVRPILHSEEPRIDVVGFPLRLSPTNLS